jgi:hypothetical protein
MLFLNFLFLFAHNNLVTQKINDKQSTGKNKTKTKNIILGKKRKEKRKIQILENKKTNKNKRGGECN